MDAHPTTDADQAGHADDHHAAKYLLAGLSSLFPEQPAIEPYFSHSGSAAPSSQSTVNTAAVFTTQHFLPLRHGAHVDPHGNHLPAVPTAVTAPTMAPGARQLQHTPHYDPDHAAHHRGLDLLARLLHPTAGHHHVGPGMQSHTPPSNPRFDLAEGHTHFTCYGELPGLAREDVSVEANDHLYTVTITGQLRRPCLSATATTGVNVVGVIHKDTIVAPPQSDLDPGSQSPPAKPQQQAQHDDVHWHVLERKVGDFRRVFQLPVGTVNMAAVHASMRNGLLIVQIPKKPHDGSNQLGTGRKINVSEPPSLT